MKGRIATQAMFSPYMFQERVELEEGFILHDDMVKANTHFSFGAHEGKDTTQSYS